MERTATATMDMDRSSDWRFWGGWGLAWVGFPLGGLAASALVGSVGSAAEGALAGAAAGAVVGAAQWLVLSRRLPLSPWWVAATGAGMAAGLALSIQLLGTDMALGAVLLRALVTGAGIGLAQSLMLRRLDARALAWGPVVALGWALGWLTSTAAGVGLAPYAIFGLFGALAFQLLSGLALAWLLRRTQVVSSRLAPAA